MINVIYILGLGHSGSTLLDKILGAPEEAFSLGEIRQWSKNINRPELFYKEANLECSCGEDIRCCQFYKEVTKDFKDTFSIYAHLPLKYYWKILMYLLFKNNIKSVKVPGDDYIKFLDRVNQKEDIQIIIDSSKTLTNLMKLLNNNDKVNVKVIHLIRDVRGVANSYNKLKHYSFFGALVNWVFVNKFYRWILDKCQFDYRVVYYDELSKNPDDSLQIIGEWLNLDLSNYIEKVRRTDYHQIAGNNMRFNEFQGIVYDDRWRTELPPAKKFFASLIHSFFYKTIVGK